MKSSCGVGIQFPKGAPAVLEELKLISVGGIGHVSLRFGSGLTAVTGESGAGKSSLVRGLELVCGKRSSGGTIRVGDETAVAEAFFYQPDRLEGVGEELQPQECSLALRRELSRSGRGKCSVQGQTVPLNTVLEIAPRLLTIQSQFAQLELLDPDRQLKILDACGGEELKATKARLEKEFYEVLDCERELRRNKQREQEIASAYGALAEIAPFLERAGLQPDSEERLYEDFAEAERELKRLRELRGRFRMLQNQESGGLISELSGVLDGLSGLVPCESREALDETSHKALAILEGLAEKIGALASSETIENLEAELEVLETSLGQIRKSKRLAKANTVEELLEYWHKGEEALRWLAGAGKIQSDLNEKIAAAKKAVAKEARTLLEQRTAAALALQTRVSENLVDVAMENAQFRIRITETNKLKANGAEKVDFVLQRGSQEIPVAKAASGGELSRILLAIQISLPDELMPPTVVFDEVEAGLGGRAAYLTGLKLRELADRVQVILITHEASIAALANRHYRVARRGTLSTVTRVEGEERVREIARMLSGNDQEEEALSHARKLLGADGADGEIVFDPDRFFDGKSSPF